MTQPELSIAVLAFNEEENIAPVLLELFAYLEGQPWTSEVLVVDDGSSDRTAEVAERTIREAAFAGQVLRHPTNRGMGAGIKSARRAAQGRWMTFLPADGQIAPEAVGTLMAARDGVEVVFSVYDHRDDGALRKALSFGVRALILGVHGVRMKSDGPYLFKTPLLDPEQLPPDTFFLNFEFPIRFLSTGLPHGRVTIACRPRRAGESKTARPGRVIGVAKELWDLRRRRDRERWTRMF